MTPRNYLYLLQKYDEYQSVIDRLLESILTSLVPNNLLGSFDLMQSTINKLHESYPFIELLYCIDEKGVQITESAAAPNIADSKRREPGLGSNRSNRVYYVNAMANKSTATVTQPYLSSATQQLAISAAQRFVDDKGNTRYLVINFNLEKLITFLNGDALRLKVHPLFQMFYAVIGGLLVCVSALLIISAIASMMGVLYEPTSVATKAFHLVILVTLGLAIFDLGKTILEEEVLLHKDIHHTGSMRRTISRFMSAIVIAVSIEALLLMFKSLLGDATHLNSAVFMLLAAMALLVGLGAYMRLTRESESRKADTRVALGMADPLAGERESRGQSSEQ
ncbi:MAG: PDC sensor domain-containing protein [Cellvibrio sp.]